jgi:hypothetical protein
VRLTGVQVAAQVGLKPRRAQELLRDLRAELDALPHPGPHPQHAAVGHAAPTGQQAAGLPAGGRLALAPPNTTANTTANTTTDTPPTAEDSALACITSASLTASLSAAAVRTQIKAELRRHRRPVHARLGLDRAIHTTRNGTTFAFTRPTITILRRP